MALLYYRLDYNIFLFLMVKSELEHIYIHY